MKTKIQYLFIAMLLLITTTLSIAGNKDWIERSNEIAYKILESNAQFAPEFSGQQGVNGYDEEIFDLEPNLYERQIKNSEKNLAMIEKLLKKETDPFLLSDFKIMQKNILDEIESNKVNYEKVMPYGNIPGLIFAGFNGLLDKQVPLERQKAALVRLKNIPVKPKDMFHLLKKQKLVCKIE